MNRYDNIDIFWRDFAEQKDNPYLLDRRLDGFKCLLAHLTKEGDLSKSDYPIALGNMASLVRMNGGGADISIKLAGDFNPGDFAGYDFVCFYPMSVMLKPMLEMAQKIKSHFTELKICLFNSEQHQHEMPLCAPRAADWGRELMEECPAIDFILIGEAELAFLNLCAKIASGKYDYADLPACLYRENGNINMSAKPIAPVDFDFLPFPARDHLEEAISPEGTNRLSPRVQSSRGCVSSCLYCAESSANITRSGRKKPWLGRDIIRFVDEIEMLNREYGVVFFNIIDSSFEDPGRRGLERMRCFCQEIIRREIEVSFKAHFRMETFDRLDDDAIRLLKEAGMDILVVGVESGVDSELRSYKKITTVEKNIRNIRRLDRFGGFFTLLGYMMFSPCLKLEDLPEKVRFLLEIDRGWDYLNMSNNLIVFRGTAYQDFIESQGLAQEAGKLSTVIPYRYIDERVKIVADEMGSLRGKCPAVISLHNLLYDALNIRARYHNKMNRHLWGKEELFLKFKRELEDLLNSAQETYIAYLTELVELAKSDWKKDAADEIYQRLIPDFAPAAKSQAETMIEDYIENCRKAGLSTSKLYLKTWMSLINTETNTVGGGMEAA